MLSYKAERKGKALLVKIHIQGSRRILYLDTLQAAASKSDAEALELLIKIHLKSTRNRETLTFDRIEVPPALAEEAIRRLRKTDRLSGDIEEVIEKPLVLFPLLVLNDTGGSFANLWMDYGIDRVELNDLSPTIQNRPRLKKEEIDYEKDLIEAGYTRKVVGNTHYFCPKENVREALNLLIDIGWKIIDPFGKPIDRQITITEENNRIAIKSQVRALLDHRLQMDGVFEGDVLYLKKAYLGSMTQELIETAQWNESLLECAMSFKNPQEALPGAGFKGNLLPYQQKGVDFLAFLYEWGFSGLLADEMGLGKTVQVLAFLSRLGTNLPVLIVAPASLLFNWRLEIEKFLPGREVELISYTSLRMNDFSLKRYEVIILDESNAIKTATTQTAKSAYKLNGKFKICMSGTPMENRMDEIFSQFHFLMPGFLEKNVETLKAQVRPFILRRKKEEVQIDLPEKIEQIAWIEMHDAQKELYEVMKKGARTQGSMLMLEAILRLRQVANDPRLIGEEIQGAKTERIILDIQEAIEERRKILVFSQFTSMLKLIRDAFPQSLYLDGSLSSAKRGEVVKRFQEDSETSLFLLSLKAAGVGLNLTAADYVFLVDPWWNEAVEKQAIDRAHRMGQNKTVIAKRYLSLGTVEEKMLKLKQEKLKASDQLLDFDGGKFSEEDLSLLLY